MKYMLYIFRTSAIHKKGEFENKHSLIHALKLRVECVI